MAKEEKQVSPEEKLLNVIKSGEKDKKPSPEEKMVAAVKPAAAPAAGAKPQVPAGKPPVQAKPPAADAKSAAPTPAGDKPKLKVAKPDAVPAAAAGGTGPREEKPSPGMIGASVPVPATLPGRVQPGSLFRISTLNRSLAAGILIALGLNAFEIWATVEQAGKRAAAGKVPQTNGTTRVGDLPEGVTAPDADAFIAAYHGKPVFTAKAGPGPRPGPNPGPDPVPPDLVVLVARLKLMGLSRSPEGAAKAILWDSKTSSMLIATAGEKILVGEQPLELIQVQDDSVVLSDGKDKVNVR